jgi:predicted MFS family arabinose efflux permease
MHCYRLLLVPFALVATLAMPAAAQAPQSWTQVGALSCQVDPNVGFIIVGSQSMRCLFTPNTSQEREAYAGALNTVGLNVGISAGGVLGWAVFAPTAGLPHGALAGEYVGVSGDVGIGLGAGANVLLGGSNRTVALQPISLQGSIALNVVAGVSSLKLRPLPM